MIDIDQNENIKYQTNKQSKDKQHELMEVTHDPVCGGLHWGPRPQEVVHRRHSGDSGGRRLVFHPQVLALNDAQWHSRKRDGFVNPAEVRYAEKLACNVRRKAAFKHHQGKGRIGDEFWWVVSIAVWLFLLHIQMAYIEGEVGLTTSCAIGGLIDTLTSMVAGVCRCRCRCLQGVNQKETDS
eukprot:XP_001704123.1 Hypothetical protein GL50803_38584 [Giardia lamblia ATCC 50803]